MNTSLTTLPESTFTEPRPDCPNPELWHAPDCESTETEVTALIAAFVVALRPALVIETGTAFGYTAQAIGEALAMANRGYLVTVDTDLRRVEIAIRRCAGLPVTVIQTSSLIYTPPGPVDFMWLDSVAADRPSEIRRFAKYASERCVIGVHDTGPHHITRSLLEPLVTEKLIHPPLYLPTPRGVCFTSYTS